MKPERIAELRRLRDAALAARGAVFAERLGVTEWQAAVKADTKARNAWLEALYDDVDGLLAAAEREDQYAAELDRCCELLSRWDVASGCNGRLCVAEHLATLLAVDEREAKLREVLEHITDDDMWLEHADGLMEWRGATHFMDIADAALETKVTE